MLIKITFLFVKYCELFEGLKNIKRQSTQIEDYLTRIILLEAWNLSLLSFDSAFIT